MTSLCVVHANGRVSFSASVRRTSMRDKSAISWKEAREEAKMRSSAASDEEDTNVNKAQPEPAGLKLFLVGSSTAQAEAKPAQNNVVVSTCFML